MQLRINKVKKIELIIVHNTISKIILSIIHIHIEIRHLIKLNIFFLITFLLVRILRIYNKKK
jgi:hypothetical protein